MQSPSPVMSSPSPVMSSSIVNRSPVMPSPSPMMSPSIVNCSPVISSSIVNRSPMMSSSIVKCSPVMSSSIVNCCDRCPIRAVRNGHVECLRSLTRDELFETDSNGQNALHIAVRLNTLSMVNELLHLAPRLNDSPSTLGETPALIAAALGRGECLETLLTGDLNEGLRRALMCDVNGTSVLMAAVVRSDNDMALFLLRRFGKALAMQPNHYRMLPLHVAAAQGNLEFIRIVTKYDRHMVNFRDQFGCAPCSYAVEGGCLASVRYMAEKAGGQLTMVSARGRSLLHSAVLAGHDRLIIYLLHRLPSHFIFAKTLDSATCFHFAAFGGHVNALRLLMSVSSKRRLRAVLNEKDTRGNTALHLAALNNRLLVAKYLIDNGSECRVENNAGQTPEAIALIRDNWTMAKMIQSVGKMNKVKKMSKEKKNKNIIMTLPIRSNISPFNGHSSGYGSVSETNHHRRVILSSRASQTDPDSLDDRVQLINEISDHDNDNNINMDMDWQGAVAQIDRVLLDAQIEEDDDEDLVRSGLDV